ncbi:TetR-like C-terminal domain-containing protein [Nocardioides litoris]|uniref:TetR-like C-terminal domain-containing protein n=1 Tax=Nocardioides litoris TaxID=1926648 RepID=UPI00147732A8|nr:TetR/AcrR family transcriptional regulator C-terminal ligand-binding domain-containing protein [Nocardioides litoris]
MARPRDPSIDDKVARACVELLGEVGRAGMTRAAVARRAGVGLPSVNRRYDDVDEVILATISPRPEVGARLVEVGPGSLRAWMVARLTVTARGMQAEPALRRQAAELMAAATGHPGIDDAFAASLAQDRAEGLEHARAAQDRGEVRPDVDLEALLDLLAASAFYRLVWRGSAPREDEVEGIVDLLLEGARPR